MDTFIDNMPLAKRKMVGYTLSDQIGATTVYMFICRSNNKGRRS